MEKEKSSRAVNRDALQAVSKENGATKNEIGGNTSVQADGEEGGIMNRIGHRSSARRRKKGQCAGGDLCLLLQAMIGLEVIVELRDDTNIRGTISDATDTME